MLKIKAFGLAVGIMWAIVAIWVTLIYLLGFGTTAFDLIDQFYFGLMIPTYPGVVLNAILFFIDGFVFGALLSWLYNKLA